MDRTKTRQTGVSGDTASPSPKQAGAASPARWAKAGVWTARMLETLERGVKGGKWFSLIDKVWRRQNLDAAWQSVRANKGASGADGLTVATFARHADAQLARLEQQLREGTYEPALIRRVMIPKPGSDQKRPLGIPTVRDRVVQGALLNVMEPIFEHIFAPHSYGFRPGRGCKDALRRVDELLKSGHTHVVDADIKAYFDSIPHEALMARVSEQIADRRLLELIGKYLRCGILGDLSDVTPVQGTPQGAIISPLLANIYLNPLDHLMASAGCEMVRYADDFVILCRERQQAEHALERVRGWMEANGLTLHPDKTRIADAAQPGDGFDFLGYHFERGMKWPRKKSKKKVRERIKSLTRRSNPCSMQAIIERVNPVLKGWFGYFKHSVPVTMKEIDSYTRGRLRSILRKRQHRQGRARGNDHQRWPNDLFHNLGLFSLAGARESIIQSSRR